MSKPRWLPLESNPDVMNTYIQKLGVDISKWQYVDVYGLDDELLCMVPKPVSALLLLFPISPAYEVHRKTEEEKINASGQTVDSSLYFMQQTVGNACGTVGVIHSVANNMDVLTVDDGHLKSFIDSTKHLSPAEKAIKLETDRGITDCHGNSAMEGQTKTPSVDEKVALHFITLVQKAGILYELDGRRPFPINHGPSSVDSFLKDAVAVCRKFMEREKDNLQFNIVALSKVN